MTDTRPTRSARFTIRNGHIDHDDGIWVASYFCERHGAFTEQFDFGVDGERLQIFAAEGGAPILALLSVAAGVSYYKAGAAPIIELPTLSPPARRMAEALYTNGLAEFFVRANLPWPPDIRFDGDIQEMDVKSPAPITADGPALVAFGGGKDSYVARAILQAAQVPVHLASVTLSDALRPVLSATAPEPISFLGRRLDPGLAAATANGFNGHVPITAINMLMLTVKAALDDIPQVVFANERSADEPTMALPNGEAANHQYSKSSHFEELIRSALATDAPGAPTPYSLLRPFSELWIGKAFASIEGAFDRFTSCNRNFRLAADAAQRWCGACAKCAFTSLIVAPHVSADQMPRLFGRNFLDHPPLESFQRDILGLSDQKPWDCVGTIEESRAALILAAGRADFADSHAVRTFAPELERLGAMIDQDARVAAAMARVPAPAIPQRYLDAAEGLVRP